jgi:hypothetical protein
MMPGTARVSELVTVPQMTSLPRLMLPAGMDPVMADDTGMLLRLRCRMCCCNPRQQAQEQQRRKNHISLHDDFPLGFGSAAINALRSCFPGGMCGPVLTGGLAC